jgi:deoxyribodipyrimidine photolyase-related protein
MQSVFIVFPHQLFENIEKLAQVSNIYLVEETLFFTQYKFHKQKLVYHRASMQAYLHYLKNNNLNVTYIEAQSSLANTKQLIKHLSNEGVKEIYIYDVCDNWLNQRIQKSAAMYKIKVMEYETLLFINSNVQNQSFFNPNKKKFFQTAYYIQQRQRLGILLQNDGTPQGGKWSYDTENRLKYPKDKKPPKVTFIGVSAYYTEAIEYVQKQFATNYGNISNWFILPTTHKDSKAWLHQFLQNRFAQFGAYEDAIVSTENILHHAVLTPMLNVGLLTPQQVINETLIFAAKHNIELNSVEGFIRQVIGWREFIRGIYVCKGTQQRNGNFWQFTKQMPTCFYTATTGIPPIDDAIKKLLDTGYNHHIERLMLLGNFMLLCHIHPQAIYTWFMEMYIDAYDWVMVPNVYGMSQFADGGLMSTKPYISASSYVLKMSNYAKGNWCKTWDALFWNFMHTQRNFFLSNPRLGMLIHTYDKMDTAKQTEHLTIAKNFINSLQ